MTDSIKRKHMRQPQYTYIGTSLGNILRKFVDLIPWENKSTQQ